MVGEYSNYSVFDVADNDELHTLLSGLPLFPYMAIKVTPLAKHPSAIEQPPPRSYPKALNEPTMGISP